MHCCHPGRATLRLFASVTKGKKGLLQLSSKLYSIDRAVEPENTERSTPTPSFKRGCKVFLNSFHGNVVVFGTRARARQPSRLVGNLEMPARQDAAQSVWRNEQRMNADEKCLVLSPQIPLHARPQVCFGHNKHAS